MSISLLATVITAVAASGGAVAAIWGLRYAKGLIDVAVRDRQVDRVLALYQDFTTGEVAAARTRFSELMYRVGEEEFGPRQCWRPDWESLIPPSPVADDIANRRRFLGAYPDDMVSGIGQRPINDLLQVLWCLDRINEARKGEDSLDEHLLVSLLGHPVTWWSLMCGRLESREGAQLYPLIELAAWVEAKGWRSDPRNEHRKVPEDDFPGTEKDAAIPVRSTWIKTYASFRGVKNQSRRPLVPVAALVVREGSGAAGRATGRRRGASRYAPT